MASKNKIQPDAQPVAADKYQTTAPTPQAALVEKEKRPIDPRLFNGPIDERECTDILCFLLFLISFVIMWWIAITGYTKGKPERLVAAYDPNKNACGIDYPDYPYIYFPILHPDYYNYTTCVKECPKFDGLQFPTVQCKPNRLVSSCERNCLNFDFSSSTSLANFPPQTLDISKMFCIYSTEKYFNRLCFPEQAIQLLNQTSNFSKTIDINRMSAWINDLNIAWQMILGSFFLAFFIGLLYMLFVRYFSGVIIWISIIVYFIALMILAVFCKVKSQEYYDHSKQSTSGKDQTNAADTARSLEIISYCLFAFWFLSLLGLLCLYHKIRLAIAVIKTAALFVNDQFLIILVPPIIAVFLAALWIWWIASVIYVVALGQIQGAGSTPFASVNWDDETRRMFWYFVFGGLWKNAFLQALCSFIIASSCAIWYFNQGETGQGAHFVISTSVYRAFRYHLGSLAFGSLILAVVQFIRIILEYVRAQMKTMGAGNNRFTKCLIDCLRCVMTCFERFIRFLTRNTYIQIAIAGKNFCTSAKEAFETIWANSMRFTLVGGIGGAFNLLGKLLISALTVMISYMIMVHVDYYEENLNSPILPCVIIFIISYTIAILFMSIYGMACDTVLMCYIYDEDLNKQTGGGSAQHCPVPLREFFEVHEQAKN